MRNIPAAVLLSIGLFVSLPSADAAPGQPQAADCVPVKSDQPQRDIRNCTFQGAGYFNLNVVVTFRAGTPDPNMDITYAGVSCYSGGTRLTKGEWRAGCSRKYFPGPSNLVRVITDYNGDADLSGFSLTAIRQ